jgi:AcrR family transcriptional regulator
MKKDGRDTRNTIIQAADSLFYSEGVKSVGVDEIAARAGITKRTLYYHFESKDALIAAYLEAKDGPTLDRYKALFEKYDGPVADRFRAVFGDLAKTAKDPRWKGCGFARAAAELAGMPGHPALAAASKHKHSFESYLSLLMQAEGIEGADRLARQLMVILDGAVTEILIHKDSDYALAAGEAAATIIRQARIKANFRASSTAA